MDYIHFSEKYEKQVINLWNECLFIDKIDDETFRFKTILDDNFDANLSYVAIDENKVVGFGYATKRKFPYLERGLEPDRGFINVLFVDKNYRRQGIGTTIYKKMEEDLVCLGAKEITLAAYSPSYYFYGVDESNYPEAKLFYESLGYEAKELHYSMGMDLSNFNISKSVLDKKKQLEDKGYKFTSFTNERCLELLEFLKNEFGGGWKRNALLAMRNNVAEELIILVLDSEDKICGFSMSAIDNNPYRFGPIGIAAEKRNEGIGSVLLNYSFLHMKNRGLNKMFFFTTDDLGKRYYERNGLHVIRTVRNYRKKINDKDSTKR